MRHTQLCFLACFVMSLASCRAGQLDTGGTWSVDDSSGVSTVRVSGLWRLDLPQWQTQRIGRSRTDLFRVRDARFIGAGELALMNMGTSEVIVLDNAGEVVRRFGGAGSGPGEFSRMGDLAVAADGSLLVYDTGLLRVTKLATDGAVLSTTRLAPESFRVSLGLLTSLADGRLVVTHAMIRQFLDEGERRDTIPLLLVAGPEGPLDTLGWWPARESAYTSAPPADGQLDVPIAFGRHARYAGRSGVFAITPSDSLDLTIFASDGHVAGRVVGAPEGAVVDDAAVAAWREDVTEMAPIQTPEFVRLWTSGPVRTTFPTLDAVVVDAAGHVWVGSYPRPRARDRDWVVFDSTGRPVARLRLPADVQVLDVMRDRIALLTRNRYDEEAVEILALTR